MSKKILNLILIFTLLSPLITNAQDTSHSSIVMDLDSGRILYSKDANSKRLIASTTKILTAIVTIENASPKQKVKIGKEVLKMYGTNIYIEVGEVMTIEDLLYGLLLRSGNDAAESLAIAVSKSEKNFVKLMNKKAQEIGMTSSTFNNPHGLDDDTKNISTATDMALLSQYASKNPLYRKIVNTSKYETKTKDKTYLWYNRNKLLNTYKYCTGGKNGYTPSAGKTLVTTASKDNLNLTIVTLDDPNTYDTHKYLYETIFSKYKNYKIVDKNTFTIDKNFYNKPIYLKSSFSYPLTKEEKDQVKTVIKLNNKNSNKVVGQINIYLADKKIGKVNIYHQKTKKKKPSLFQKLKNLFIR